MLIEIMRCFADVSALLIVNIIFLHCIQKISVFRIFILIVLASMAAALHNFLIISWSLTLYYSIILIIEITFMSASIWKRLDILDIIMKTGLLLDFMAIEMVTKKALAKTSGAFSTELSFVYSDRILLGINFGILLTIWLLKDRKIGKGSKITEEKWFEKTKSQHKAILFCVVSTIVILFLTSYWELAMEESALLQRIFQWLMIVFLFILLLYFYSISIQNTEILMEKTLNERYIEDMKDFIQVLRSQRHDFNFHLESILGMIESENYNACKTYLQSMIHETKSIAEVMPLDDPAISALLYVMKGVAEAKGIEMHCFIYDDMSRINCSVYDINKILGNLIQNAIDEVEANMISNPWITITTLQRRNYCIIRVENPVNHIELVENKLFEYGFSTKENHSGIGLNTVNKIVTTCHGSVYPEIENDRITFIVQIPILEE